MANAHPDLLTERTADFASSGFLWGVTQWLALAEQKLPCVGGGKEACREWEHPRLGSWVQLTSVAGM